MRSKQEKLYIICMIKKVYFLYNYSINCWVRIDPEAQKCKQETKINNY